MILTDEVRDEWLVTQAAVRTISEHPLWKALEKDLARYCRAHTTAFHPDARVHAALEGRREVWLRLREYLDLTPDELVAARTRRV